MVLAAPALTSLRGAGLPAHPGRVRRGCSPSKFSAPDLGARVCVSCSAAPWLRGECSRGGAESGAGDALAPLWAPGLPSRRPGSLCSRAAGPPAGRAPLPGPPAAGSGGRRALRAGGCLVRVRPRAQAQPRPCLIAVKRQRYSKERIGLNTSEARSGRGYSPVGVCEGGSSSLHVSAVTVTSQAAAIVAAAAASQRLSLSICMSPILLLHCFPQSVRDTVVQVCYKH